MRREFKALLILIVVGRHAQPKPAFRAVTNAHVSASHSQ